MAVIYLVSALALGTALVRRIPFPLYRFEAVAMVPTLGLLIWTWLGFLLALVLAYDIALPILVVGSAAATIALWPGGAWRWRPLEGGRRAWIAWGIATTATTAILGRLFWTHSLTRDSEGIWSAAASWADYGLHSAIVSHIAAGTHLPSDLPIASGEKITYPYLIDLLSGFYSQGGMGLHGAFFWPGILLGLAICQLMISVGLRLFGRISVGIGGLGIALTLGSFAGTWAAWSDWRDSGKGFFAFLGNLPADYSQTSAHNANLTNLLVDGFIPQRSLLFGLSAGLVILTLLVVSRDEGRPRLLWPAAVLIGLMPLAHPHTFIVGIAFLAFLAAERTWRLRTLPSQFLGPLGAALVVALPQIIWQQTANGHGTGGRFRLGWLVQGGESVLGFYWANFGLLGIALLAAPIVLRKNRQVFWLLPMLVVLLVTQLYAFQPFEYDNLKLIWWVLIVGSFFVSYAVSELVRKQRLWLLAVVPVGFLIVAPGALAIKREFQLRDQFMNNEDIAVADWVSKNTPVDAVFATTDMPNMPVSSLAGRTLVNGYGGWMFNFNIPYQDRNDAVRQAFLGRFEDPRLKKYGADYVLIPTQPDTNWPTDEAALKQRTPVYSNSLYRVYQLQ